MSRTVDVIKTWLSQFSVSVLYILCWVSHDNHATSKSAGEFSQLSQGALLVLNYALSVAAMLELIPRVNQ